jgi:excisionase family DNA binding protein
VADPARPDDLDDYLTLRDLAGVLKVSVATVSRLASHDTTMPALRLGRTLRFPRTRVLAWLRAREQGRGRPRLAVVKGPTDDAR